jgi:hypothetical protein
MRLSIVDVIFWICVAGSGGCLVILVAVAVAAARVLLTVPVPC